LADITTGARTHCQAPQPATMGRLHFYGGAVSPRRINAPTAGEALSTQIVPHFPDGFPSRSGPATQLRAQQIPPARTGEQGNAIDVIMVARVGTSPSWSDDIRRYHYVGSIRQSWGVGEFYSLVCSTTLQRRTSLYSATSMPTVEHDTLSSDLGVSRRDNTRRLTVFQLKCRSRLTFFNLGVPRSSRGWNWPDTSPCHEHGSARSRELAFMREERYDSGRHVMVGLHLQYATGTRRFPW
jgi:hypothetical protein